MALLHHMLLALSVAAVAGAAMRVATLTGARGLERAVAAAAIGVALAVGECLILGLVGLGASPVALSLAAGLTWLAARRVGPEMESRPAAELAGWWRGSPPLARLGLAASLGAGLAWAVWLARYPVLGADSMIYHVPEVVEWVHSGRPGGVSDLFPGYPVGAYPLTNEVAITWAAGISRSFVPFIFWAPITLMLLAVSGWTGLRALAVPRLPTALAVTTLCLTPGLTHWQKNGAHTDLPALAWLACAGALCAASVRRPALTAPMLLAIALSVGIKTTTLPLSLLLLAIAGWVHRHRLRELRAPLAVAAAGALLVGGIWYARNLWLHGSPFWPFVASPWGDPVPKVIAPSGDVVEQVYTRFIERPGPSLEFILGNWARPFLGGLLLVAFALVAPLVARTRPVLAAAAVTAISLLSWMNAPFTGISEGDQGSGGLTTMRYLLPTFLVAALTVALVGRVQGVSRHYALGTLGVALVVTVWQLFELGYPSVPAPSTVVLGALLAAAAAALAVRFAPRGLDWARVLRVAALPLALLTGAALTLGASGFLERYRDATDERARLELSASSPLINWFLSRPGYEEDNRPIAFTAVALASLAGDRLQHPVDLIPPGEDCSRIRERIREGWVVVNTAWSRVACVEQMQPVFEQGEFVVYRRP